MSARPTGHTPHAPASSGNAASTTPPTSTTAHRSIQALSAANTSLYGVVHAVIVALGCSPGLGFVHTGHIRSFVYDIADLYKTQITIPIAFDIATRDVADIGAETRRTVRDHMKDGAFLTTCVSDIKTLLAEPDDVVEYGPDAFEDPDVVMLWDSNGRTVAGGTSYGADE